MSTSHHDRIRHLLTITALDENTPEIALSILGELINLATNTRDAVAAQHAVTLGIPLTKKKLPRTYRAQVNYFLSNAWATIHAENHKTPKDRWAWRQPELDQQIIHLRLAREDNEFKMVHHTQRAQILTNLANVLDTVGRTVEAIELYDEALKAHPAFGMALGNKGRAIFHYAASHHDQGQQAVMCSHAHKYLSESLETQLEGDAASNFEGLRNHLATNIHEPSKLVERSLRIHKLGRSNAEVAYRKWALANRLFLNPLNDLGDLQIASHDPMSLPVITTALGVGPKYHGLFNQLKQEYVSARFFMYDSSISRKPHFSDRQTHLVDTLDYPAYGIGVEKAKLCLRTSYSILDKISFFIDAYLNLNIPKSRINFTNVWHLKGIKDKGLNPLFDSNENWPLRGLYWLSRDGFDDVVSADGAIEPAAREIKELRRALEHRYVKVHMEGVPSRREGDLFFDELAHSTTRLRLEQMALRALKDSRAAIIYLSLAVSSHERRKNIGKKKGKAMPITLPTFDDRYKS